jgi:hypothetical protein
MDVILRSRVGAATQTVNHGPKKVEYVFNEANEFQCKVPTVIEYVDDFGHKHRTWENFAQHLLDNVRDDNKKSPTYGEPMFEIVEMVEEPAVKPPTKGRPKKEKQNE